MDALGTIVAFLGILIVLVVIHELGHFLVAKRAGITVEEFGIGFPPRIASVTWRGTRYSLNWIPLGGFVRMLGEDGDVEIRRLREKGLSEVEVDRAMEGAFNRRPVWIRIGVLLAGVLMNFILAGALYSVVVSLPQPVGYGPLTIVDIQEDSPAAGKLEVDDVITAADNQVFERSRDLTAYVAENATRPVTLTIERDGESSEVTIIPRPLTAEQIEQGLGPIGIAYEPATFVEEPSPVDGPLDAVRIGFTGATEGALAIPGGLASAVGGLIGLNPDGAGDARGPIGIAEITGEVLQAPLAAQLEFVAVLSLNLAVLNVLPFPPLDGGRMAVVLLESARRRRLPPEREALIYLTGFAVLLALIVLISIQDIQRLITGS